MQNDLSLDDDVAALEHEAQKAVDREIAARAELEAAIENRISVRAKIADGAARAAAYIDAYVNPVVPNPPPLVPEIAAPMLDAEPPVFTTVEDLDVAPDNSSGGFSEVDDAFDVAPMPELGPEAAPVGDAAAGDPPASDA